MKQLDLHGVQHEDVQNEVHRFINEGLFRSNEKILKIITGHSPKMIGLVVKVLDGYKLPYRVGGYFGNSDASITVDLTNWI